MNIEKLSQFLVVANQAGYANQSAPRVASLRPQSEDYHFEKDGLIYHDTYFGGRDFIGEEIVYENDWPIWGANYFGFVLDKNISEKEVYAFLRQALLAKDKDVIPVRGPKQFSLGDKEYRFMISGNLNNFSGTEEISFTGKVIYRCYVHGGMIS